MKHITLLVLTTALAACSDDKKTDSDFASEVAVSMRTSITADLANLVQAAKDLQVAAPTHAWDATADSDAIGKMRAAWRNTRIAYEHVEGATAPLFGDLDLSMDARLDDFLPGVTGEAGDLDLFDDVGVTGMHAIERILYARDIRPEVLTFEHTLPGETDPSYPTTAAEAMEFKNKLCQKLIDDATALHDQWNPAPVDEEAAFDGLVGLMNEQKEKVNLAATGEEESRYANMTLFDLRNNLEGTSKIYAFFQPWIQTKSGGADADAKIQAKFSELSTLYNRTQDDALPLIPSDWSAVAPTTANLATPFGMIWGTVHADVDPNLDGSVVFEMNKIAVSLGFKPFTEDM
jgi:iron uptake system component EfeO